MATSSPRPLRKRPCSCCRKWFQPDARVGNRQRACPAPACQAARKRAQEARWRRKNPDYFAGRRWQAQTEKAPPEPARAPSPLDEVPWDVVQTQMGAQAAVIIALLAQLLLRTRKRRGGAISMKSLANPSDISPAAGKRSSIGPP